MEPQKKDVLRETDADAIRLARTLMRSARYGALAVIDPESGAPIASRVAVASDHDGAPLILVSSLAAHTGGLLADPRCSLLLGEPGKGDPLAHARITIACEAEKIDRDDPRHERIRWRFLSRNPKAKLYADFKDFAYFRLQPRSASLNGGFARAYALTPDHLLLGGPSVEAVAAAERSAVSHMNDDHSDAIQRYARHFGRSALTGDWVMTGIDVEGFDLVNGDHVLRIHFDRQLETAQDMHKTLVAMAIEARQAETSIGPEASLAPANDETSS